MPIDPRRKTIEIHHSPIEFLGAVQNGEKGTGVRTTTYADDQNPHQTADRFEVGVLVETTHIGTNGAPWVEPVVEVDTPVVEDEPALTPGEDDGSFVPSVPPAEQTPEELAAEQADAAEVPIEFNSDPLVPGTVEEAKVELAALDADPAPANPFVNPSTDATE